MSARLALAAIERIAAIVIEAQLIHKMRYNKKRQPKPPRLLRIVACQSWLSMDQKEARLAKAAGGNLRLQTRAEVGGRQEARTPDLRVANAALSQLS